MENNVYGKNGYAKADFDTDNVAIANAGIRAGDISVMNKKVSNNTNNIGLG